MPEEFLIGSGSRGGGKRKKGGEQEVAPRIGIRFVVPLVLLGSLIVGAGAYRVATVNQIRDYEMEAARKQELIRKRRDLARTYESRIANLLRVESLREAASTSLGMEAPQPDEIETLIVTDEDRMRWQVAAQKIASDNSKSKGGRY